jgi:F-type H+-transporting ATPase subunit gamma
MTRAMGMIAASKLRHIEGILHAGRPYARQFHELLGRITAASQMQQYVFFAPREERRIVLLVITGDRGLCGAFNSTIIARANAFFQEHSQANIATVCIGKKGARYFHRLRQPPLKEWSGISQHLDLGLVAPVAQFLLGQFSSGAADAVYLLYTAFVTRLTGRPTVEQLLPIQTPAKSQESDRPGTAEIDYIVEPTLDRVVEQLVPQYVKARVTIALTESLTAEHSARMIAMNNAAKNCEDLVNNLTLKLNKARQASITKELLDIIHGAEALLKH